MSTFRELVVRLAGLFARGNARRGADADLQSEMRFHLDMLEEGYRREGMTPGEARRRAHANFGGLTQLTEAHRDQRTLPWLESVAQDLRYGARMLARTPGFTLVALLTLALGIGANTAIFSVVNAVVLRPLPYAGADRIVSLGDRQSDGLPGNIGYTTLHDYRERARTFEHFSAIRSWTPTLVVNGEAERVVALRVSWNYFDMLGVRPALGRSFRADEDRPDHWRVLVISDGLWRRRFGAAPDVIGRSLRMNDREYRIVGVLPPDFDPLVSAHFFARADMWAPLGYATTEPSACRGCRHLKALGKVREGVSLDAARAELDAIRGDLAQAYPTDYSRGGVAVVRLRDVMAGPVRGGLLTLLAAVGAVLLIACANVANLLLARAMHRSREVAVRAALGASRARLTRQLLTESILLGVAGGLLGIALAALSLESLLSLAPVSIPRLDQVALDRRVLAFACGISVLTGVAFGLIPAIRSSAGNPQQALLAGTRTTAGSASRRTRHALVIGDLALAFVLLAGAGLMLKSVERLMKVDTGFDARDVLTLQFSLVGQAWAEDAAVYRFIQQAVAGARALPGVESAAVTGQIPMSGNYDQRGFHIEGRVANPSDSPSVERYSVTPDYLRVLRIPLLSGRFVNDRDTAESLPVLVVAESTARTLWPGESPIGHRVRIGAADTGPWRTIVGVVGDVRHFTLDQPPTLQMYVPQSQITDSFVVLAVRSGAAAETLLPALRGMLRGLDPTVPVYEAAALAEIVRRTAAQRQFVMQLLGGFAGLALLLAAIGLYGVVSYTVARRTREVGVRVALGATPRDVVRLILGSGAATVAAGLAAGLAIALVATRFMQTLLYGVEAEDPATLVAAAATLALVATLAHWLPVRRALRIDPALALRQDL